MLAHLTDTLTTLITNLYVSTGLLGIVLAMAIESCCIPLPSEIVMPLAGIMVANGNMLKGTNTLLGLFLVALAGSMGCLLGSVIAYGIGYKGGRPLMLKYGRYVLISQHDADIADRFFQRWGSATAFFSRLLPVVRTYISLPAGITKMPFVKFCLYTVLGSLPWCFVLAYLGTILQAHLDVLSPIFHTFDVVILVALIALIVLYVWRHVRNDRKAREAHSAEVAADAFPAQSWTQQPAQPQQWNQPQNPQQQWGQPQNPQQQPPWAQQPVPSSPRGQFQNSQFQQWSQPGLPGQPGQASPPQQWGQPPAQQQWGQPQNAPAPQQWGHPQNPQAPQQWGQPQNPQAPQQWEQPQNPQPWPPQTGR